MTLIIKIHALPRKLVFYILADAQTEAKELMQTESEYLREANQFT